MVHKESHLIGNLLDEQNIDIFAVTETWLPDRDPKTVWLESTTLSTTNLKMQVINRQDRWVEGLDSFTEAWTTHNSQIKEQRHHLNLEFGT